MSWLRRNIAVGEAVLALAMAAGLIAELEARGLATTARVAAGLLVTLPLAVRLTCPLLAMALVAVGVMALSALGLRLGDPAIVPVIAVLLALYGVGSRTTGPRLVLGAAIAALGLYGATLTDGRSVAEALVTDTLLIGAGLVIGRALGLLRFEGDELEAQAELAVAQERRRMARELHDVIGHSISVMGVQAGAVRSVLREDQQTEREMLLRVERVGRQAVGEMRRLIGLLREDELDVAAPMPSLTRVDDLVADLTAAGRTMTTTIDGDVGTLSPGLDLAGYRVVQEALTNAIKHAPDADIHVQIDCAHGDLRIAVSNTGPVLAAGGRSDGFGLIGMRERVALYGGELAAGPLPTGGFAVRARIPLEA